jgi:hypothetical protein
LKSVRDIPRHNGMATTNNSILAGKSAFELLNMITLE